MHLQLGGDLPLRMTVIAWKRFFADRQDWDIVLTVRPPSPASVMTPTTNFSCGSPAIVGICYIGCYHLNVRSTTVYVSVATITNCLNELLCSKPKTTLRECCIEIDLRTYDTFIYISCKLDSVLSVILLKFLCYVMLQSHFTK